MEFKYDKTQQKILRIVATVCTILPLLAILMGKYLLGRMPILIIAVIFKGVPLALGTWVLYGESLLYFRELRRHGIEPPLHKNDAAEIKKIMNNMSKADQTENTDIPKAIDTMSVVFCALASMCGIAFVLWMLWKSSYYVYLGMNTWLPFFYIAGAAAVGVWTVYGIRYWKQKNNAIYKNEGDPDLRKKKRPGLTISAISIVILIAATMIYGVFLEQAGNVVYYIKLKELYGNYYGVHKGERVDLSRNQAMRSDWEKYIGVFPPYDQGGTVYEYERHEDSLYPFMHFRTVYDADWEGTRAMERYCTTLDLAGWKKRQDLLYTKTIGNMTYVTDLQEWDQYGKKQVVIEYYSYDDEGHGLLP